MIYAPVIVCWVVGYENLKMNRFALVVNHQQFCINFENGSTKGLG
jgi:hypothetical protein